MSKFEILKMLEKLISYPNAYTYMSNDGETDYDSPVIDRNGLLKLIQEEIESCAILRD